MLEVLLGGILSVVTSWIEDKFPNVNNLFVLAGIALVSSIVGSIVYWFLSGTAIWEDLVAIFVQAWAWAIALYQIFKNLNKIR